MAHLTGPEIRKRVANGDIRISPYQEGRVQAASVDLTLGTEYLLYESEAVTLLQDFPEPLDTRRENPTNKYRIPLEGIVLHPGILYLMHTVESLHTMKYGADVAGKSSLGRLGILVHHTAGYVDPGFDGQVTLEVAVCHPVKVYAGMEFCQVRFYTLEGEIEDYRLKGHYTGAAAQGAQPSRSWQQALRGRR